MSEERKEFDLDSLQADWEAEWTDEEEEIESDTEDTEEIDETIEDEESDEGESTDTDETETDESDIEEDENETQEETTDPQDQAKPNEEVETLQRQLDLLQQQLLDAKKSADVFDEIAKQSGVSRDELIQRYEKQRLQEEAKAQNVPVEFLEKQRQMERELQDLREGQIREKFNSSVANLKAKYNLSNDDIKSTLDYAYTNGIDPFNPTVNLDTLYKTANFDKILERQVKEARQKELENKQKRMKTATVTHNGNQQNSGQSLDDEVRNFLKEVL